MKFSKDPRVGASPSPVTDAERLEALNLLGAPVYAAPGVLAGLTPHGRAVLDDVVLGLRRDRARRKGGAGT